MPCHKFDIHSTIDARGVYLFQAAPYCFGVWRGVTELARQKPGWIYAALHLHKSNFAPVAACAQLSRISRHHKTQLPAAALRVGFCLLLNTLGRNILALPQRAARTFLFGK